MRISSAAEQVLLNHCVVGSNPTYATNFKGVSMKKFLTAALMTVMCVSTSAYGGQSAARGF